MDIKKYFRKGLLSVLTSAILILPGCKKYKTEYSEPMHEDAKVTCKDYRPYQYPINLSADYYITFAGKITFEVDDQNIFCRLMKN